jgi:aryl-alcohol dehydrogenase-like predicted oxidoreductase
MTDQPDRPAAATGVTSTPLGSVGLTATNQGLGCMGMSEFYGETDDAMSHATLDAAREVGVTFWDTANIYGPFTNELLLGAYFRTLRTRHTKEKKKKSKK